MFSRVFFIGVLITLLSLGNAAPAPRAKSLSVLARRQDFNFSPIGVANPEGDPPNFSSSSPTSTPTPSPNPPPTTDSAISGVSPNSQGDGGSSGPGDLKENPASPPCESGTPSDGDCGATHSCGACVWHRDGEYDGRHGTKYGYN